MLKALFARLQAAAATRQAAEKGQTLAEYGLIVALIAVFAITALGLMGTNIDTALTFLGTTISGTITGV